tara:strand:- start:496 stop:1371 length:876 start_codon:yes stop_codon:yes gene_type:complete
MNRIVFGDNQFFGVNHLSESKGREQLRKFKNISNITNVLDFVNDNGIKSFMVTTYSELEEICEYIASNQNYDDFIVNPCLPYAHKYANEVTENGIFGTVNKYLKGNIIKSISKGSIALIKKDFYKIMEILVDSELSMFKNVKKETIFLQNVVTDLLLGLGMDDFFVEFEKYINKNYNLNAGFITMNMPLLYDRLKLKGVKNPIICTSFNKANFRMSGGISLYEEYAKKKKMRLIAMQVLAAGYLSPKEAFKYISQVEGVDSILFGSSNTKHILGSKKMIEKYTEKGMLNSE